MRVADESLAKDDKGAPAFRDFDEPIGAANANAAAANGFQPEWPEWAHGQLLFELAQVFHQKRSGAPPLRSAPWFTMQATKP